MGDSACYIMEWIDPKRRKRSRHPTTPARARPRNQDRTGTSNTSGVHAHYHLHPDFLAQHAQRVSDITEKAAAVFWFRKHWLSLSGRYRGTSASSSLLGSPSYVGFQQQSGQGIEQHLLQDDLFLWDEAIKSANNSEVFPPQVLSRNRCQANCSKLGTYRTYVHWCSVQELDSGAHSGRRLTKIVRTGFMGGL